MAGEDPPAGRSAAARARDRAGRGPSPRAGGGGCRPARGRPAGGRGASAREPGGVPFLAEDPLARGALAGLWSTCLAGLTGWGILLGGLGLLFTAAATSLLDTLEPLAWLRRAGRAIAGPPPSKRGRLAWGLGVLGAGLIATLAPTLVLSGLVVVVGTAIAIVGAREIFRLLLESVETSAALARSGGAQRSLVRTLFVVGLALGLATLWLAVRNPLTAPVPSSVRACNGHKALCDRRLDEVAFPGTHNSMSNAEIRDWMFPHHQRAIPRQLRDGVRALLIDVHYGFPGASRIKTDLSGERPTREILEEALGEEGLEAAMRIRARLVGCRRGAPRALPLSRILRDRRLRARTHPPRDPLLPAPAPRRGAADGRGGLRHARGPRPARLTRATSRTSSTAGPPDRPGRSSTSSSPRARTSWSSSSRAIPASLAAAGLRPHSGDALHLPRARGVLVSGESRRHRGLALPDQPLDRDDARAPALERRDRERPRLPALPRAAVPARARPACRTSSRWTSTAAEISFGVVAELNGVGGSPDRENREGRGALTPPPRWPPAMNRRGAVRGAEEGILKGHAQDGFRGASC